METTSNEENFKYIIENTILQVNRVLEIWKNNKNNEISDKIGLFRFFFSKFFYKKYNSDIYNFKENYPYCIIDNYIIISIDLNISKEQLQENNILMEFNNYIKNYDFLYFNEKNSIIV